jgi:hypothetical protein
MLDQLERLYEMDLELNCRVPGETAGKAAASISKIYGVCQAWKKAGHCARLAKYQCEFAHPINQKGIDKGKGKGNQQVTPKSHRTKVSAKDPASATKSSNGKIQLPAKEIETG